MLVLYVFAPRLLFIAWNYTLSCSCFVVALLCFLLPAYLQCSIFIATSGCEQRHEELTLVTKACFTTTNSSICYKMNKQIFKCFMHICMYVCMWVWVLWPHIYRFTASTTLWWDRPGMSNYSLPAPISITIFRYIPYSKIEINLGVVLFHFTSFSFFFIT